MKTKAPISKAKHLAEKLIKAISDVCERAEIAGSIRRGKNYVGDIEIVVIPKRKRDLFGDPVGQSLLNDRLQTFFEQGKFSRRIKNGEKFKQFEIRGCSTQLDLFITDEARFPVIFTIRTGPADFSRQVVTPRSKGGCLQNGCRVSDGRLLLEGKPVDLRDEQHFFEFVQGGWTEPEDRK